MPLISNQLSPNLTEKDTFTALPFVFGVQENLDFSPFFGTHNYVLTNAARTAIGQVIKVVQPDKQKKIGIPAFICAVVATPFLEAGYEICWIDTDENGVIDFEDFEKKADQISLVVVPHIFGQRAPVAEIFKFARKKGIFVLEDCAHLFDVNLDHCDAKIFSFGREKVFSCVSGGALLWPKDNKFAGQFEALELPVPSVFWTLRHALQPLICSLALRLWRVISVGKVLAFLARKSRLLPLAVTPAEKQGREDFPVYALPLALQKILFEQFSNAVGIGAHRKNIASAWEKTASLRPSPLRETPTGEKLKNVIVPENCFRVILKTSKAAEIRRKAKEKGFDLREWDGVPVSPAGVDLEKFGYGLGSCPRAEYFAGNYVTFPTHVKVEEEDAAKFNLPEES